MDIQPYDHEHGQIFRQIDALRELSRGGVRENAVRISEITTGTASPIKFHVAAEDRVLYPAMSRSGDAQVATMSARYRGEMQGGASGFAAFVAQWRVPSRLVADPDGFRRDANIVLRALFDRLQRESVELYPAAEAV